MAELRNQSERGEWTIFENTVYGWLSPSDIRSGESRAPTIDSLEELEAFIQDLLEAGERMWPTDRYQEECAMLRTLISSGQGDERPVKLASAADSVRATAPSAVRWAAQRLSVDADMEGQVGWHIRDDDRFDVWVGSHARPVVRAIVQRDGTVDRVWND